MKCDQCPNIAVSTLALVGDSGHVVGKPVPYCEKHLLYAKNLKEQQLQGPGFEGWTIKIIGFTVETEGNKPPVSERRN